MTQDVSKFTLRTDAELMESSVTLQNTTRVLLTVRCKSLLGNT